MARYIVQQFYASRGPDGAGLGPWGPGDSVELGDAQAAWVNSDAPGTLAAAADVRAVETPPKDRMLRRQKTRIENTGPIDKTVYRAVKDK